MARDRFSIITDGLPNQLPDIDREETREWLESLDAAIDSDGRQRARFLMLKLLERAREHVLEHILRVLRREPEALHADRVHITAEPFDQRRPRSVFSRAAAPDEVSVGRGGQG